jgi:serine/threonine-protein kinase
MRALVLTVLLALPVSALAEDRHDAVDGAIRHCQSGDANATLWIATCTTAIDSGRVHDPHLLSWLYSNRGFGNINLALGTDNNFDNALVDLNEAVRIDPDNQYAFLNRANAYMYRGEYQRSLDDTNVVIRLDPKEGKSYSVRCTDLTKLGRPQEGIAACQQAIDLGEQQPWTYCYLGAAYEAAGDLTNAERAYRQALSLDSEFSDAVAGLRRVRREPPI